MRKYDPESDTEEMSYTDESTSEESYEEPVRPKKKVVVKNKHNSSDSDDIPADKYYSLSRKPTKTIKDKKDKKDKKESKEPKEKKVPVNKVPLKVPKKPTVTIQYTEIKEGKQYNNNYKGANTKDIELYNKAQSNIDNIKKIVNKLNKEMYELINSMHLATPQKKKAIEKNITDIEQDVLQLNKLYRYYYGIVAQLDNKYIK